jgi:enoyl-CoA hydratase/carnithine racemase
MAEVAPVSDQDNEIVSHIEAGIGWIKLNRPKALNSLSFNMIRQLTQTLTEWSTHANIKAVVVQGEGDKAFCAGGDVRAAYMAKQQGNLEPLEGFFREEYALNTLIHEYPKPYITILDGIAMGGGLGVSLNSPYAVLTDRSILAMPETAIGFFPDVGATWFLSNVPDSIGIYWAMTGNRFTGADAVYAGLGTTYLPSGQVSELLDILKACDDVIATLRQFHQPPTKIPVQLLEEDIHYHFNHSSVAEIIASLESADTEFSASTLKTLRSRSPLSVHIAFEQLKNVDPKSSFRERMQREFRLSQRFIADHDFFEGVRAVLVDKDQNPQWQPTHLEDVTAEKVQSYFAVLSVPEIDFINWKA